jgi:hypothetical protein
MWELVTREPPYAELPPFEAVLLASTQNLRPKVDLDRLGVVLIGDGSDTLLMYTWVRRFRKTVFSSR